MATLMKDYAVLRLGEMATYLGWTNASAEVLMVVEDTLEILGLTLEADSTNPISLKAVTMYVAWRAVVDTISTDYTFSADKAKYNRSDMVKAAQENFNSAKREALPYISIGSIVVGTVTYTDDPYKDEDLDEIAERSGV